MQTKPAKIKSAKNTGETVPEPKVFGDLITVEISIMQDSNQGIHGEEYGVVIEDVATDWIQLYPTSRKTADDAKKGSL